MDWAQIAPDFEWDGSLRDIYVLGTTSADWQRVLDQIADFGVRLTFTVDGEVAQLPDRASDILASRHDTSPLLCLDIAGIQLNCHFFSEESIEFDLDPTEVAAGQKLEALAAFMALLAEATGKSVVLTPENLPLGPILRVAAGSTEVVWIAPPSH